MTDIDAPDTLDPAIYPKGYGPSPKPLRMRRRRDGTLALLDRETNDVNTDDPYAPDPHVLTYKRLRELAPIMERKGDTITLRFINATVTYTVTDEGPASDGGPGGIAVTLHNLRKTSPVPLVDEEMAYRIAVEQREARINDLANATGITPTQAEDALIHLGAIPFELEVPGPKEGEQ